MIQTDWASVPPGTALFQDIFSSSLLTEVAFLYATPTCYFSLLILVLMFPSKWFSLVVPYMWHRDGHNGWRWLRRYLAFETPYVVSYE